MSAIDPPLIHTDPHIVGGTPVFVGRRLSVATLLACVDVDDSWERIVASWPFLTPAHVDAARPLVEAHRSTT